MHLAFVVHGEDGRQGSEGVAGNDVELEVGIAQLMVSPSLTAMSRFGGSLNSAMRLGSNFGSSNIAQSMSLITIFGVLLLQYAAPP